MVLDSKVVETVQISGPTILLFPNASAKYDKGRIPLDLTKNKTKLRIKKRLKHSDITS